MKYLIAIILLAAVQFQIVHSESARKVTVKIKCEKMHCEGCRETISEALNSLDGVIKYHIDLKTKIITVTYESKKTGKEQISAKILESGYENQIMN